jgi:hypothetical protein
MREDGMMEAVKATFALGMKIAPMMAQYAKGLYDEGVRAGLTPAQAWELAMHGIKNTQVSA